MIKEKAPFSLSMSTALMKNGTPRPNEYSSSMATPWRTFPWLVASSSAEPRKAPTQGVHPTEKTTPKTSEEKKPRCSTLPSFVPRNRLTRNTPKKFRPKKMTMSPVTKLTTALYSCNSVPKEPAKAPSSTNTSVKPRIKPRAFFTTRFVSLSLSPAK